MTLLFSSGDTSSTTPEVVQGSSGARHDRHAPTEGAQRAGAAALARIEQQHQPKVHTSYRAIRSQGETHNNNTIIIHSGLCLSVHINLNLYAFLHVLVVKRELEAEAEAAALSEKQKAAAAEVRIRLIWFIVVKLLN